MNGPSIKTKCRMQSCPSVFGKERRKFIFFALIRNLVHPYVPDAESWSLIFTRLNTHLIHLRLLSCFTIACVSEEPDTAV